MRAFLAVFLLLAVAFAGCSSGDTTNNEPTSSSSSSSTTGTRTQSTSRTSTSSSTTTTSSAQNHPPIAGLAIANVTGTLPLNVTFRATGTDSDGDSLTWTMTFGDNSTAASGTTLPTNVTHSYTAQGNFTAVLTVRDAKSNATANVTVSAGGSAIPTTYTFAGTAVGVHEPLLGEGTGEDITHTFAIFGPVQGLVATLTWEIPGDLDLYINNAAGEEAGRSACLNADPAPETPLGCNRGLNEEVTLALTAADAGDWTAIISPFEAPSVDYTLTIAFT